MSAQKGEGDTQPNPDDEPGPSHRIYSQEHEQRTSTPVSTSTVQGPPMQMPQQHMGRLLEHPHIPVPHPPLRVKRPGRPRIHPPKPAGISKPRGRPRGSKNKKPRKKVIERPPKRPRGRPRKWPREMWEGFQRSQATAVSHQMHTQQGMPPQDIAGPSHIYYEEQLPLHHQSLEEAAPPLSHLPLHLMQQEPQIGHPTTSHMQQAQGHMPPMTLHHQEEMLPPMTLMQQQQYMHEQQQEQQHLMLLRQQQPHIFSPEEQQQQLQQYYPDQPPHTTS